MTTAKAAGFVHWSHVVNTGGKEALQKLAPVHFIISLLKRWLGDTHQEACHAPATGGIVVCAQITRCRGHLSQSANQNTNKLMDTEKHE